MNLNNTSAPSRSNICAIIITFNPDEKLPERVKNIRYQVDRVVIIDNNSNTKCIKIIKKICEDLDVDLIQNNSNLGVAEALNQGFNYIISFKEKYSWALTLDQDTCCLPSLIDNHILAYNDCPYTKEVGVIGSNYSEKTTSRLLHNALDKNSSWEEVQNLPTSGCITSISSYKDVGEFRNDFFIDYIDTEYCMRMRKKGYKVLISTPIGMIHPLGYYRVSKLHKWLKGKEMVTNYPSYRHYYWTRNGSVLIWENLFDDLRWSLNEIYYIFIRRVITILLFEDMKLNKFGNMALGLFHAISSKKGKKS